MSTLLQLAQQQNDEAIAGKINGTTVDLSTPVAAAEQIEWISLRDAEGIEILRHTTAHILAQALKRLYGAVLATGPVIEHGFYYDVFVEQPLRDDDLSNIEAEMKRIVATSYPIERQQLSYHEARQLFAERQEPFKLQLIDDFQDETLSIYRHGEFIDLCRGPHLPNTNAARAFRLTHVSGAYWRGDANEPMLQRVYGVAFPTEQQLVAHFAQLEEAKRRDHRKLGQQLDLFMFAKEAPGMPFFLPKGMLIRHELESLARRIQRKHHYEEVKTPLMLNEELWHRSGHWAHYEDNMYFTAVDEQSYALKPMNCPGHMLIYNAKLRSYRDLPLRLCEFGQVHRHEASGALSGMTRVRTFCQDDAHLFVRPDQIKQEIAATIAMISELYEHFNFSYRVELSTRPADSLGSNALWQQAEAALYDVLHELQIDYTLNEGDGAFYGPKIDFHIDDALGRSWQCGTIQLDFQMPERFQLVYIGEDQQKHRPVVIHRAMYGSLERFIAILIEHYGGAFPLWLAPVQVTVLPIASVHHEYGQFITAQLQRAGLRVELDERNEKLGYKLREAQLKKIPYVLVIGDREQATGRLSVRAFAQSESLELDLHELLHHLQSR